MDPWQQGTITIVHLFQNLSGLRLRLIIVRWLSCYLTLFYAHGAGKLQKLRHQGGGFTATGAGLCAQNLPGRPGHPDQATGS